MGLIIFENGKKNYFAGFTKKLKQIVCMAVLLGTSSLASAQTVSYYGFSQSQETFTPLSNPTNIAVATGSSAASSLDETSYELQNAIPFQFPMNGAVYSTLRVHSNGFISFGSASSTSTEPISASTAYSAVISPLSADLQALYNINGLTGSIDYEVVGTAPNREFVVQWKNFKVYSSSSSSTSYHNWTFQARLSEDGSIKFVYDLQSVGTPSSANAKVGLRGSSNTDYVNRTASGTSTSNWVTTTAGTMSSNGIATNYSTLPPSGLTFKWDTPQPCIAPAAQPTALALTNTGIIINGSFTASNPSADRYLVLRNLAGTNPNPPVNGTVYSTGQNTDLNSYVAYYGSNTTFENNYNNGIKGNTEYIYTIYSVNSNCSGGPLYNTVNPLSGSIINCPITVNGISASSVTANSFTLSWPAPENGMALSYNTIIEVATDGNFTNQITGSPFTITPTTLSQIVSGLQPNTKYYYRGKNVSTQCESSYSSVGNIYTACIATDSFSEGFDGISTGTILPNCWSKILVGTSSSVPTINVTSTSDYVYSAPNGVTFYGNGADMTNLDNKAILVSPQLTNVGNGTHRLRFKAKKSTANGTHAIRVVALSSNDANATIEVIKTIPTAQLTASWQEFSVNFDNYTGTAPYVGIQRVDGASYSYMSVDDVVWEPIPACPDLTSITVNYSTPDGANISWTPANTAPVNGYEYVVTTNTTPSTGTFTPISTNTVTLTNLTNGTYYFWVKGICSSTETSAWKMVQFTTIPTTPAPWQEEFLTSSLPLGWITTGWSMGTTGPNTGVGNSNTNLYKNLYSTQPSGEFSTIAVGPLSNNTFELSFYYKQANFNSPYAPLADWGKFDVQVSTDFGASWTTIGTVDNEAGTGNYIQKTYPLANYAGEYVKVKIVATRTAGDYYLSFDNFEIKSSGSLSINETAVRDEIVVYPNPTSGIVNIKAKEELTQYELFNVSSQKIKTGFTKIMDITSLNSGVYILKIQLKSGKTVTQKIIKK